MTLDQLRKFAASKDLSIRQIALTKEGARAIIAEHDREVNAAIGDALLFEIDTTRDAPPYAMMERARIDRLREEDERAAKVNEGRGVL